jgi:putative ABC transport system permease protein
VGIQGDIWKDICYGWRLLRRDFGFSCLAVLILALGIGASTSVFSVVNAVLLHSLPYRNSQELVDLEEFSPSGDSELVSPATFEEWTKQCDAFQGLASDAPKFYALSGGGDPDEVWVSRVSTNLFDLLGGRAALGQTFWSSSEDDVVLSDHYWRSHFSSKVDVVGKTIVLDGKPFITIGVMPPDFYFREPNIDMWIALTPSRLGEIGRDAEVLSVVGRLKSTLTIQAAQAELSTIDGRSSKNVTDSHERQNSRVRPFRGRTSEYVKPILFALLGAVTCTLLIASPNVTNMFLAQGSIREGEMAVRAALGAGRWRLIRQLLLESIMVAGTAGLLGVLLAKLSLHFIISLVPKFAPIPAGGLDQIRLSIPVLTFAGILTIAVGMLVGLIPALRGSGPDLNSVLKKKAGRGLGVGAARLQGVLVTSEIVLALVLLIGAGLMVRSFHRLESTYPGFTSENVLTVRMPLPTFKYGQGPQSVLYYEELLQRLGRLPGVSSLGLVNNLPLSGFQTSGTFARRGSDC